jgi:hypothetical protein
VSPWGWGGRAGRLSGGAGGARTAARAPGSRGRRRRLGSTPSAPPDPPPPPPPPRHPNPSPSSRIDNPKYKGIWVAPDIDNPEFKPDPKLHVIADTKYVGFELWQVKAGSIFDNIMVTDDFAAAKKFAEETWGKTKDAEKAMMEKIKKVGGGVQGGGWVGGRGEAAALDGWVGVEQGARCVGWPMGGAPCAAAPGAHAAPPPAAPPRAGARLRRWMAGWALSKEPDASAGRWGAPLVPLHLALTPPPPHRPCPPYPPTPQEEEKNKPAPAEASKDDDEDDYEDEDDDKKDATPKEDATGEKKDEL